MSRNFYFLFSYAKIIVTQLETVQTDLNAGK